MTVDPVPSATLQALVQDTAHNRYFWALLSLLVYNVMAKHFNLARRP